MVQTARPARKIRGDRATHAVRRHFVSEQGWLYLATVIDCFNKEVIGYAMADHMRTELVTDALDMAVRNHSLEPGCVVHSDRGRFQVVSASA